MYTTIYIDGESLSLEEVNEISRNYVEVKLSNKAIDKINISRAIVEKSINEKR